MKKFITVVVILFAAFSIAMAAMEVYACELHFSVISADGAIQEVSPDREAVVAEGENYTLRVEFIEDHRNCITPPEATMYILQDEKWKATKDYLPLQLQDQGDWGADASHIWIQEITFKAAEKGTWELEVIRDCPKGGYDELIVFNVQ